MPPKARSAASSGAKPKKKANGYKFPEKLPCGEVLEDSSKKQWILGESIGQGGFGEIYCASEPGTKNKWPFVIKIEPHENGPLFMEKNFYIKVAKPDDVKSWKQKEGMKTLGIPMYLGSGTYLHKGSEKYRFLVIDRYGKDLWSLFLKSKVFPPQTVYKIALQIIDALRYIHSKGYVHGDIKGQNLLLGLAPGTENQVFLVDFGLACKYSQKEFQRDPKKAHNGTIEYTSCDMHMGVPTRRGDLEILGYNLLYWLSGSLPWERDLSKCEIVHKKKQELMGNVNAYISSNFSNIPQVIIEYMEYVSKLKHDQEPDYKYIEQLFIKELKKIGASKTGPLEFESKPAATTTPKRTSVKRTVSEEGGQGRRTTPKRGAAAKFVVDSDEEEEVDLAVHKKSKVTKKTTLKAAVKKATAVVSDEEEDSPTQVVKSKANSKPKVHTSSAMSTVGKRRAPKPNVALSDEDMFESEGSDFEDSGTSKPKRSTKKAVSNGHPKSTKRSAASAGSPSKKTKTTKNTKPPLTKKLDYRDAPKCLLPGIREEN